MINLNEWQRELVASQNKAITWLFYVIDKNGNIYEWSTKNEDVILGVDWLDPSAVSWDADWVDTTSYAFKVLSFSGITVKRSKSEFSLISPNETSFVVSNKDHALTPSNFVGGKVWISLYIDNGDIEGVVRRWRFKIKSADPGPHEFEIVCEDFFQEILKGDYPNTRYARDIFPTSNNDNSSFVKVPVPFGQCYIPLKYCAVSKAVSVTVSTISFIGQVTGARCEVNDSANGFGDVAPSVWLTISGAADSENNGTFQAQANSDSGTIYLPESAGLKTASAGVSITVNQDKGFFMLGRSDVDYTISALRRPRELGVKLEWTTGFYQYDIADADAVEWTLLEPIIVDSDNDGTDDTPGFFLNGDSVIDTPVKFTRSDTATMTNPADVIKYVLKDMGVVDDDINSDSFTTAATIFDSWGLEFNGAFWYNQTRTKALSKLLNMCHAAIYIDEQVNIMVLDNASQDTITSVEVLKTADIDSGTFSYSTIVKDTLNDSGYVSWQPAGEAQDKFNVYKVPAKTTTDNLSDEVLEFPFVQNSQDVQKLGSLYYQRKLLEKANISFSSKSTLLGLLPDQMITINQDIFGGNYDALIDSISIAEDAAMTFQGTVFL